MNRFPGKLFPVSVFFFRMFCLKHIKCQMLSIFKGHSFFTIFKSGLTAIFLVNIFLYRKLKTFRLLFETIKFWNLSSPSIYLTTFRKNFKLFRLLFGSISFRNEASKLRLNKKNTDRKCFPKTPCVFLLLFVKITFLNIFRCSTNFTAFLV